MNRRAFFTPVKKLIQVLKENSQHQYIIATHSPAAISAADPVTMTVCKFSDGETKLEVIDPDNGKALQSYLVEAGARLGDVFGADNILWVEAGPKSSAFQ